MLLSKKQVDQFWRLWSQYCQKQGWTKAQGFTSAAIDARRKEFLLSCGFSSLTLVDRTEGFTRVLHELLAVVQDSVASSRETAEPELNRARVLRHKIRELVAGIGVYHPNPEGYLRAVMEDKARWWTVDRPERDITLDDLDARPIAREVDGELRESPSHLDQILITLQSRLNQMRKAAGDTTEAMRAKAGLKPAPAARPGAVDPGNIPF